MAATERPWHIRDGTNIFRGDRLVANTGGYATNIDPHAVLRENRANAALIVKAVNHHEELRAALFSVLCSVPQEHEGECTYCGGIRFATGGRCLNSDCSGNKARALLEEIEP